MKQEFIQKIMKQELFQSWADYKKDPSQVNYMVCQSYERMGYNKGLNVEELYNEFKCLRGPIWNKDNPQISFTSNK